MKSPRVIPIELLDREELRSCFSPCERSAAGRGRDQQGTAWCRVALDGTARIPGVEKVGQRFEPHPFRRPLFPPAGWGGIDKTNVFESAARHSNGARRAGAL